MWIYRSYLITLFLLMVYNKMSRKEIHKVFKKLDLDLSLDEIHDIFKTLERMVDEEHVKEKLQAQATKVLLKSTTTTTAATTAAAEVTSNATSKESSKMTLKAVSKMTSNATSKITSKPTAKLTSKALVLHTNSHKHAKCNRLKMEPIKNFVDFSESESLCSSEAFMQPTYVPNSLDEVTETEDDDDCFIPRKYITENRTRAGPKKKSGNCSKINNGEGSRNNAACSKVIFDECQKPIWV